MLRPPNKEEYVMVFPTSLLKEIGYFQGLSDETGKYLQVIVDQKNYLFMKRREIEADPTYKQLIPYAILNYQDTIFSYRRGKLLSEERLFGNYSIGIGGHISIKDPNFGMTGYREGLYREMKEEVDIKSKYEMKAVALLSDDTDEVSKMHFGIIYIAELEAPLVRAKEKSINEGKFVSIPELKKNVHKYEGWSQICINHIEELLSKFKELCSFTQPLPI